MFFELIIVVFYSFTLSEASRRFAFRCSGSAGSASRSWLLRVRWLWAGVLSLGVGAEFEAFVFIQYVAD